MTWHKKMKEEKNRTTIIYHWIGCNPFIMHICDNNVSTVFNGTLWGFSYANKHICAYTYNDCEYCDRYWSKCIERMKLNIVFVCIGYLRVIVFEEDVLGQFGGIALACLNENAECLENVTQFGG